MTTKAQVIAKAKKNNVKINIEFGDEYVVVEMDAWNQQWSDYKDGHGITASGDTAKEAYSDAINLMDTISPCSGCEDKFCKA